jgi:hypothetical protein
MSVSVKLAAFGIALAAIFVVAWAAGSAWGPTVDATDGAGHGSNPGHEAPSAR